MREARSRTLPYMHRPEENVSQENVLLPASPLNHTHLSQTQQTEENEMFVFSYSEEKEQSPRTTFLVTPFPRC